MTDIGDELPDLEDDGGFVPMDNNLPPVSLPQIQHSDIDMLGVDEDEIEITDDEKFKMKCFLDKVFQNVQSKEQHFLSLCALCNERCSSKALDPEAGLNVCINQLGPQTSYWTEMTQLLCNEFKSYLLKEHFSSASLTFTMAYLAGIEHADEILKMSVLLKGNILTFQMLILLTYSDQSSEFWLLENWKKSPINLF